MSPAEAGGDAAADEPTRRRILDSAAGILAKGGFASARVVSAIARGAGLSRPTVYRYFSDVDSIRAALIRREIETFLVQLGPRLDDAEWSADYITELLAFAVEYGHRHELLQAALREVPEALLPFFTTHAEVSIDYVADALHPLLERMQQDGRMPADADPDTIVDVLARITLSLVFTTSRVNPGDPVALRRYIADVIALSSSLSPAPESGGGTTRSGAARKGPRSA